VSNDPDVGFTLKIVQVKYLAV